MGPGLATVVVVGAVATLVLVLDVLGAVAAGRAVSASPPEQAEAASRQTATANQSMRSG
jgi:hypothetical protein